MAHTEDTIDVALMLSSNRGKKDDRDNDKINDCNNGWLKEAFSLVIIFFTQAKKTLRYYWIFSKLSLPMALLKIDQI